MGRVGVNSIRSFTFKHYSVMMKTRDIVLPIIILAAASIYATMIFTI